MGKKNVNPADAHSKWPLKSSFYRSHSQPSTNSSQIHLRKEAEEEGARKGWFPESIRQSTYIYKQKSHHSLPRLAHRIKRPERQRGKWQ